MDDYNRKLYKLPTLATILGEPYFSAEVMECTHLGPVIRDFVKKETYRFHQDLIDSFDEYTIVIWNKLGQSALERLITLENYMHSFEDTCGYAFASAYVAYDIERKGRRPKRDVIYSFCDEHAGGDMDSKWVSIVGEAISNYKKPEWPPKIAKNPVARASALEALLMHMGYIEDWLSNQYIEVKRLIDYGH